MPDCFRGGAPPRLWADFLSIFLIGAIYSLPRYIVSSPQGVYRSKPEMHMKDDIRPLIPVAAETQVDLQNRPEDQVLARQNTSGHKSDVLSPQDSGWVRPTNLRIKISSETVLHLKFSALDRQCSSPRDTGRVATPDQGIDVPL